jgi:hypothetical protein
VKGEGVWSTSRGAGAAALLACLCSCTKPDPDALLHAQDLPGASKAWEKLHGSPLDIDHPAAQALAVRAGSDASITAGKVAEAMSAVRLLERSRGFHAVNVDEPFDTAKDLFAGVEALAAQPVFVAVGRATNPGDPDPTVANAPLPWAGGRLVASSRKGLADLGARLDKDPPAGVVTMALHDTTGELFLFAEHADSGWVVHTASDTRAAVRVMRAAEILRDQGLDTMHAREGEGILER